MLLNDVFLSTVFNICMLVVLAYMMTKLDFVKKILVNRETVSSDPRQVRAQNIRNRVLLGFIMGAFCIVSNFIGFHAKQAIPNSRVIGAMSAGLLGGPISGFIASVIGAVHRYLGAPTRISTPACVLATLIQGAVGSLFWYLRKKRVDYSYVFLFVLTMVMESMHMGLIYMMSRPLEEAIKILRHIATSMIFVNPIGMVLFFNVIRDIFAQADHRIALRVSDSLRTAERCMPYLQSRGDEREDVRQILKIIMEESPCAGAAIVRDYEFLGCTEAFSRIQISKDHFPEILQRTREKRETIVKAETQMEDNPFAPLYRNYLVISAPIVVSEGRVDCLVVLEKPDSYAIQSEQAFISGLADLFSAQLMMSELEEQKNLRRHAELQSLQSQINPHFLFNALNTISFFCREKPEKARELLLALSTYFRNTLQDVDTMISLEQELKHVRAYLLLEEARFEEHLKVEIDTEEEALKVQVPNLILQPLVENAVKHGAKTREYGRVRIQIRREGEKVQVSVMDNGPGIPEAVAASLSGGPKVQTGIGFLNVHKRLVSIFGPAAGLQVSRADEMTRVQFELPMQRTEEITEQEEAGTDARMEEREERE